MTKVQVHRWTEVGALIHQVSGGLFRSTTADCRSPQRYLNTLKRPTPVRRRFKDTNSFVGSSAAGGRAVLGLCSDVQIETPVASR